MTTRIIARIDRIAEGIEKSIGTHGTIAFAGLDRVPSDSELRKAIVSRAIFSYQAHSQTKLVLTVPSEGLSIGARQPSEIYETITRLLDDGYTLDQIEWSDDRS